MKEKIAKDAKKNLFLNKLRLIYKVLSQRQSFKPDDTSHKKKGLYFDSLKNGFLCVWKTS